MPGSYAVVKRIWSPGDVIELTMPMPARLIEAHPKVEEARNQVAIMRGPVVYCMEAIDLPKGVPLAEVLIPRDLQLTPRHDAHLLGGVTVLEGEAYRLPAGIWSGKLYRTFASGPTERVALRLIPYYAWNNRVNTQMSVWFPVR